jgi:anaphase-promoting complex subunit 3
MNIISQALANQKQASQYIKEAMEALDDSDEDDMDDD